MSGYPQLIAALCLLALSSFADIARAEELEKPLLLRSGSSRAVLTAVEPNLTLQFQAGDKRLSVTPAELIRFGNWRPPAKGPLIVLIDHSLLRADVLELTSEQVKLGDATGLGRCLWNETTLPLTQVRAICFDSPADELARDKLLDRLSTPRNQDELWLSGSETLAGLFQGRSASKTDDGTPPPPAALRLQPNGAKDVLSVPLAKCVAIAFNTTLAATPAKREPPRLALGLVDGSLIYATAVTITKPDVIWQLACGAKLSAPLDTGNEDPPRNFWEQIGLAQAFGPHVTYLSDVKPVSYKHVPLLTLDSPFLNDRSVLGGRLRNTAGHAALKGLGLHSAGRLVYDVPPRAERFEAELALDARAGQQGSVIFRVLVQNEAGTWTSGYESPIVRGAEAPLPVAVPLAKAQRIALLADFADRGDELDYANWLDARFILKP